MSTQDKKPESDLPLWQKLTGLTPDRESKLAPKERDAAIRILVKEVDQRARAEFARAGECPPGERTVFWEPLERICLQLEISRTKLSSYSRELTGMRAHEICDRIKAAELPAIIRAWLEITLHAHFEQLRKVEPGLLRHENFRMKRIIAFTRELHEGRAGPLRARWAVDLGYPNASRLSRACLLAHGMSIHELEARILADMVQKFCDELCAAMPEEVAKSAAEQWAEEEKKFAEEAQQYLALMKASGRLKNKDDEVA